MCPDNICSVMYNLCSTNLLSNSEKQQEKKNIPMSGLESVSLIALLLPLLLGLLLLAATGVSFYAALIIYVRWKYSHLPSPKTTR